MALTGKPSVIEARAASAGETSAALRPLQSVIAAIRERLRLIEAELNALITRTADVATGGTAGASFNDLQEQINALRLRIEALEAITLTDWYVNGGFISTRRVVNFIQAGGITISGADDGSRANITFGALVDLLIPLSRGGLVLSGRQVGFQLGRFIDVSRRSLVLTGRALGLSLSSDTLLTVSHGALRLSGRNLGLELTQDVDLPVVRGALRLTGRNVGLGTNLPVARGHLGLTGRDVGLAVGGNVNLGVSRGTLGLGGRAVGLEVTSFDFFRDFADLSTADLTVYKGTVSALTGELIGTPTSGSVHERVYFNLLPTGSPTDISGAWEIVVNLRIGVGTTLNGILFNTQGDNPTDNTRQNGYWLDTLGSQPRLIKHVAGGSTVLKTAGSPISTPSKLRVTYDGVNTFHCEANGSALFSDTVDSTFTHGQIGLIFFANPGVPGSVIDIGVNYTP